MWIPKEFVEPSLELQIELIRQHSLGTIITSGPNGITANHFPFLVNVEEDSDGNKTVVLTGHFARINPQKADFEAETECLVIFQGPHDYISPSWYKHTKAETGKTVPTWDFATVHVYGKPKLITDPAWIHAQVDALSDYHEESRPKPWKLSDAPESYVNLLQKAIYGLEIRATRVEGKWKMSQDKRVEDVAGVVEGLQTQGEQGCAMADVVSSTKKRFDTRKAGAKSAKVI